MGLFDFIGDGLTDLTEVIAESITRLPELPLDIAEGAIKGISTGIDKLGEKLDDLV
jgi:hypothetical protein